jgi:selenocysteine lyase/cysteine desulfurase
MRAVMARSEIGSVTGWMSGSSHRADGGLGVAWRRRPGYLDTATYGLPPLATVERSHRVIEEWADGDVVWRTWNDAADEARRLFASLVGVAAGSVAVGTSTSGFVGVVAAGVTDGTEVVVPEGEFTSLLFPFLVQAARGITVREVPLEALADAVGPRTGVVAWSAVQSSDGRIADAAAVLQAARAVGALTVVDVTQAAGWLPLLLDGVDAAVCSGYKWLCCPRGTAFMVTSPRLRAEVLPHSANWFAADDVHAGYYGSPLRLAPDARRFDVSPAWFSWIGAVSSLGALAEVGVGAIHRHDAELADALRVALGLDPAGSAIVSIHGDHVERSLAAVGIKASTRANGCRLAFHLYNDHDDVAAAATALRH